MATKENLKASEAEIPQPGSEPYIVVNFVADDQDPRSEEPTNQGMEMGNSRRPSFRSAGLMTKIGRGVKSAVGGAINMIVGKVLLILVNEVVVVNDIIAGPGPGQNTDPDFVDVCKV